MPSRLVVVTPAPPGSTVGNRVTAERWAARLGELGCDVAVAERWDGEPADALVALHAVKSLASIQAWLDRPAPGPLIVGLAGTDVYGSLEEHAGARAALGRADRIVALQPLAARALPPELRERVRTILQSAEPASPAAVARETARRGDDSAREVVVLSHLRAVKDPLLPARAARSLPADSRIAIALIGRTLEPEAGAAARAEAASNPRLRLVGELAHEDALARLAGAAALCLPSREEGGANAIGEAAVAGVPILAARNDGAVGLLGDDHPGLFPPGDTQELAALLERLELDPAFAADLAARSRELAPAFAPEREREAWRALLAELGLIG